MTSEPKTIRRGILGTLGTPISKSGEEIVRENENLGTLGTLVSNSYVRQLKNSCDNLNPHFNIYPKESAGPVPSVPNHPLMSSPPVMAFEDEESLFDRITTPTMTKDDVDWLWARGDQYAAARPWWTFRQCQLAACCDYERRGAS